MDGKAITEDLSTRRSGGAGREELLREAVRLIEAAEDRFDWVGIYLLEEPVPGEDSAGRPGELVLHHYVGRPTEHVRIPVGRGVCGTAVARGTDMNVPDVREAEDYLACSPETASELVVLIQDPGTGRIFGQVDVDSDRLAAFTQRHHRELRLIADWLAGLFV